MEKIAWCRKEVFKNLWSHYYQLVPYAPMIEQAFRDRGDSWIEDHVAFRTLPGEYTGKHILQQIFEILGYKRQDDYHFAEKKLDAFWMSPDDTAGASHQASPKIFISELIPSSFSDDFKSELKHITAQVSVSPIPFLKALEADVKHGKAGAGEQLIASISTILTQGPSWARPTQKSYQLLKQESDYAAWTYLFGHQINHFTVSSHLIESFSTIEELGSFIENKLKIPMNHIGGMVKGTPEVFLEQIATMAAKINYQFQDNMAEISYGFVEFAKRYPLAGKKHDGNWHSYYQGFVSANADKIFESTYK